jgi:hypothetical protein
MQEDMNLAYQIIKHNPKYQDIRNGIISDLFLIGLDPVDGSDYCDGLINAFKIILRSCIGSEIDASKCVFGIGEAMNFVHTDTGNFNINPDILSKSEEYDVCIADEFFSEIVSAMRDADIPDNRGLYFYYGMYMAYKVMGSHWYDNTDRVLVPIRLKKICHNIVQKHNSKPTNVNN